MSKQIKKVGLLKEETSAKKPAAAMSKGSADVGKLASHHAKKADMSAAEAKPAAKKGVLWLLVSLLLLLIVIPKPSLVQYQKLNIQTTSIYWPGVFGIGAGFTDSELEVLIDESRKELSLCFQGQEKTQCTKYQIIKHGNFIEVIKHLF